MLRLLNYVADDLIWQTLFSEKKYRMYQAYFL